MGQRKTEKLLLTISAMPDGVGAAYQPSIPIGKPSLLQDDHRDDGRPFIVHADEKLSVLVELERQVLTMAFYLESIRAGDQ